VIGAASRWPCLLSREYFFDLRRRLLQRQPKKSPSLIEKVAVDFLDGKRLFNPASNIMANHQLG